VKIANHSSWKPAAGAILAVLCGLLLWKAPFGEPWVDASYDYLFRFGTHAVTNQVTVILMDNEAFDGFHQTRDQPWDRGLHAQLLNRLADDHCALVAVDSFFRAPHDPAKDTALAEAMRRQRHIVLMAEQAQVTHPSMVGAQPTLPAEIFLAAARTNWGVAWLDPDLDGIVRHHWPFPMPGPYPSLASAAAQLLGAKPAAARGELWLRYYGPEGAWTRLSYRFALSQAPGFFRDQIVFIGTQPKTSLPDNEPDEFRTPYFRWTNESTGGAEIMLTALLNLINNDALRRQPAWLEALLLAAAGAGLGAGLCRLSPGRAGFGAIAVATVVALGSICASYYTNYWFPWLIVTGGQVPCALAWAVLIGRAAPRPAGATPAALDQPPGLPSYELFQPAIGEGAYGKVWLARTKSKEKEWRALKIVFRSRFGDDPAPYDREFAGVSRYQPVSDKHPGMLRVEFVSEKRADYFYYVMELGDALEPGWEKDPAAYKPRNLSTERARFPAGRMPVRDCLAIGLALADALDFLHRQGLTHRDIKPPNIIFVDGRPKLADVGLTAAIRPAEEVTTLVGTPGYMPPAPEPPGTREADIYSLGKVLYVLGTGCNPSQFPDVSTIQANDPSFDGFLGLNTILLKACNPFPAQRYASAAEMGRALRALADSLDPEKKSA
jgi:CHASE2 domain-containing sensor protein